MQILLVLSDSLKQQIIAACEAAYPEEGCGILLGRIEETGKKRALLVRPTANAWDAGAAVEFSALTGASRDRSRRRNFAIDPADLLAAQKAARAAGLDIIGIFHSHTDAPATPSEFDRAIAWAEYDYLIVAVVEGRATDLRCWRLGADRAFQETTCHQT